MSDEAIPHSKFRLPSWPQRGNKRRQVEGIRRRIRKDLHTLNQLAYAMEVETRDRSAFAVIDDVLLELKEQDGESPTYAKYREDD